MEFRGIRGLSNQLLSACGRERISCSRYCLHSSEERCIAHELSYRGIASKTLELHKTGIPSSVCLSWKKEYNLWWVYKPCKMILFFYLNGCLDWSTVEDSIWWGFKASSSPFCISGAVMGFLKFHLSWKDFNRKENREQSLIPFLLQNFFIFFLPAPQLDVTGTILRGLKA